MIPHAEPSRSTATRSFQPSRAQQEALAQEGARRELQRREAGRNGLIGFTEYTKPNYEAASHHRQLAEKLEAVERGEISRLMVTMPPRHGKSELVSRRFPAYALGKNPRRHVISASYGIDLALDFSRDVRNLIAERNYQTLFPKVFLAPDSAAKNRWHTNEGGGYVSAGVGTAITGRGADILNIDDPVKDRAEAESPTIRDSIWGWYTSTAYTRLQPKGAIVLTMTRWHEDDLAGRLLNAEASGGEKWEKLDLQAFNADGTALWKERYPPDVLRTIRGTIGERDWAALYEQRPRPVEGSFFTVGNLLVDDEPVEPPDKCDAVFATVDSATKTGKTNDGTAVVYWARNRHIGHPLTILGWDLIQIEGALLEVWLPNIFDQLELYATACRAREGVAGVWIEDKASGMILLQQAHRRGLNAHAIDSKLTSVGKSERAINISGYVSRGMVKFSRAAYEHVRVYKGVTRNHLLTQILNFNIGTKDMGDDDALDAFCYGVAIGLGNSEGY